MEMKTYGDRKQISVGVAGRPAGIRGSITKGQEETFEGDKIHSLSGLWWQIRLCMLTSKLIGLHTSNIRSLLRINGTSLEWGGVRGDAKKSSFHETGAAGIREWGGARPRMLSPSSSLTNQIPVGRPGTAAAVCGRERTPWRAGALRSERCGAAWGQPGTRWSLIVRAQGSHWRTPTRQVV